ARDLERHDHRRERRHGRRRGQPLLPPRQRPGRRPAGVGQVDALPLEGRRVVLLPRRGRRGQRGRRLVLPRPEGRGGADQGPRRVLARRAGHRV
ncbi:MAG: hypothetical protein AVDCRST_MAG13-2291, partial [uncultured Solirubrobacteraceae bacterium]